MSINSRKELLTITRMEYQQASWKERRAILDSFTLVTGHNRKYATKLLNEKGLKLVKQKNRSRFYDDDVVEALIVLWKAANKIASKRLIPFLPALIAKLKQFNHIVITSETEQKLLRMSAATADRLLKVEKKKHGRSKGMTRPGRLLKSQVEVRTFTDWNEATPGFFEADLVSHSGGIAKGLFLNTLTMTDIFSGWIEMLPVIGKSEQQVLSAIRKLGKQAPFPMLGLDTDNGSEFINYGTIKWCENEEITFTRAREYEKNDQAHVEEKNGSVVRRIVGYDRFEGPDSLKKMSDLYSIARLYINFFQPSMKLVIKERNGGKTLKKYDQARTPYQRLVDSDLSNDSKEKLTKKFEKLDPVALLKEIETRQIDLWSTATYPYAAKIAEDSFAAVLAKSADLEDVLVKAREYQSGLKSRFHITLDQSLDELQKRSSAKYGATATLRTYVAALQPGETFRYKDMENLVGSIACQILHAMVRRGELLHPSHGVYQAPGESQVSRPSIQITGKPMRDMHAFVSALPPGTTFMRNELLQFGSRANVDRFLGRLKKKHGLLHVRTNYYTTIGGNNLSDCS